VRNKKSQTKKSKRSQDQLKSSLPLVFFKDTIPTKVTKNIPYNDPSELINSIINENKESLGKFRGSNRKYNLRTDADLLIHLSKKDKLPEDVKNLSSYILKLITKFNENYQGFLQDTLYSGIGGMIDAQRAGVISFVSETNKVKIPKFKPLKIKEVYKDDEVTEIEAETVIFALERASELVPDKYKKSVKPITLLIRSESSTLSSCSTVEEDEFTIVLNLKKNNLLQTAEAFHEYLHIIEKSNRCLLESSNKFLKSRITDFNQQTIESLAKTYAINFSPLAKDVFVYPGRFIDPYIGRTYGDIEDKVAPTEVFSVGGEILFLDPVGLFIKDREYFDLISSLILGKI
jgi:hypothetical protein